MKKTERGKIMRHVMENKICIRYPRMFQNSSLKFKGFVTFFMQACIIKLTFRLKQDENDANILGKTMQARQLNKYIDSHN